MTTLAKSDLQRAPRLIYSNDLVQLYEGDCFRWLEERDACSLHAVVTDPPFGLVEYSPPHLHKLRNGRGGGDMAHSPGHWR